MGGGGGGGMFLNTPSTNSYMYVHTTCIHYIPPCTIFCSCFCHPNYMGENKHTEEPRIKTGTPSNEHNNSLQMTPFHRNLVHYETMIYVQVSRMVLLKKQTSNLLSDPRMNRSFTSLSEKSPNVIS